MFAKLGAAAVAVLLSTMLAWAGDPVGRYRVVGSNPANQTKYAGMVTVERTGETFRVTWRIGKQVFVGTGIGGDNGFAVAYRSGNRTGIAIYVAKGVDWKGLWTYAGGRAIGAEAWIRR